MRILEISKVKEWVNGMGSNWTWQREREKYSIQRCIGQQTESDKRREETIQDGKNSCCAHSPIPPRTCSSAHQHPCQLKSKGRTFYFDVLLSISSSCSHVPRVCTNAQTNAPFSRSCFNNGPAELVFISWWRQSKCGVKDRRRCGITKEEKNNNERVCGLRWEGVRRKRRNKG